jgi:hypothetical protein
MPAALRSVVAGHVPVLRLFVGLGIWPHVACLADRTFVPVLSFWRAMQTSVLYFQDVFSFYADFALSRWFLRLNNGTSRSGKTVCSLLCFHLSMFPSFYDIRWTLFKACCGSAGVLYSHVCCRIRHCSNIFLYSLASQLYSRLPLFWCTLAWLWTVFMELAGFDVCLRFAARNVCVCLFLFCSPPNSEYIMFLVWTSAFKLVRVLLCFCIPVCWTSRQFTFFVLQLFSFYLTLCFCSIVCSF